MANMKTGDNTIWGECNDMMKQRLQGASKFRRLSSDGDGIGLIIAIKDLVYKLQNQKYLPQTLHE